MEFNKHSLIEGTHAFLSASQYHWLNYNEEKLKNSYISHNAKLLGTELHEFAANAIRHRIKVKDYKKALYCFINDAIGFNMLPEQPLYYSINCYGTADAISFNEETNTLRIFDLKTGKIPCSFKQLDIYSALFCLEYNKTPHDLNIIERIYQFSGYTENIPNPDDISNIMKKIVEFDKFLEVLKKDYNG